MSSYIMRLDDACEKRDIEKWDRIEAVLDKYGIKPLVGVIPHCEDPEMEKYDPDPSFWQKVSVWLGKGWSVAMHGYNHVYSTSCGGINPVNKRSEFAGEPLEVQKEKIRKGVEIMRSHGVEPEIFFAPSHTFDENTLVALKEESNIRAISDTIAWDSYRSGDFVFIPQQSGRVRKLPFKTVTFCYHPNMMSEQTFSELEDFLQKNGRSFKSFSTEGIKRKRSFIDNLLSKIYFGKRK